MQDEAKLTGRILQALDEVAGERSYHFDYGSLYFTSYGATATDGRTLARVNVLTGAEEGLYRVDVDALRPDEPVAIEQTGAERFAAVQRLTDPDTVIFAGMEQRDLDDWPSRVEKIIPERNPTFEVNIEYLQRVLAVLQACGAEYVEVSQGEGGLEGAPVRLDGRRSGYDNDCIECVGLVSRYVRAGGEGDWD